MLPANVRRKRFREGKVEQSVLDVVLTTDNLNKHIESMTVDEEGKFKIVNYKNEASVT